MARFQSYVICTAPRSGSTLLCRLLTATGIAGRPESWFHEPSVVAWVDAYGLTPDRASPEQMVLADVFRAATAWGSEGSDMFGLRLQRHSFDFFLQKLAVLYPGLGNDAERFRAAFGRTLFLYLRRCDKIGQAISYVKASQSGLWHRAPDGTEIERLSPPRAPVYDADAILAQYRAMVGYDADWERWFAAEGIEPMRQTYEDLSANPVGALRCVLDRLGLDPAAADGVTPGTARLADEISLDWAARFRAEHRLR